MKRKKIFLRILMYGSFMVLFILYSIYDSRKERRYSDQFERLSYSDSLSCQVSEYESKRGGALFIDNKGKKYKTSLVRIKEINDDISGRFTDFLEIGDSLYKNANSDTVYLYKKKNEEIYLFKIVY